MWTIGWRNFKPGTQHFCSIIDRWHTLISSVEHDRYCCVIQVNSLDVGSGTALFTLFTEDFTTKFGERYISVELNLRGANCIIFKMSSLHHMLALTIFWATETPIGTAFVEAIETETNDVIIPWSRDAKHSYLEAHMQLVQIWKMAN